MNGRRGGLDGRPMHLNQIGIFNKWERKTQLYMNGRRGGLDGRHMQVTLPQERRDVEDVDSQPQTHKHTNADTDLNEPGKSHPTLNIQVSALVTCLNRFRELDANQTIYKTSMANVNQGSFIHRTSLCLYIHCPVLKDSYFQQTRSTLHLKGSDFHCITLMLTLHLELRTASV